MFTRHAAVRRREACKLPHRAGNVEGPGLAAGRDERAKSPLEAVATAMPGPAESDNFVRPSASPPVLVLAWALPLPCWA
jgi:hypothetical protein